jgi:hypothetical protein
MDPLPPKGSSHPSTRKVQAEHKAGHLLQQEKQLTKVHIQK